MRSRRPRTCTAPATTAASSPVVRGSFVLSARAMRRDARSSPYRKIASASSASSCDDDIVGRGFAVRRIEPHVERRVGRGTRSRARRHRAASNSHPSRRARRPPRTIERCANSAPSARKFAWMRVSRGSAGRVAGRRRIGIESDRPSVRSQSLEDQTRMTARPERRVDVRAVRNDGQSIERFGCENRRVERHPLIQSEFGAVIGVLAGAGRGGQRVAVFRPHLDAGERADRGDVLVDPGPGAQRGR